MDSRDHLVAEVLEVSAGSLSPKDKIVKMGIIYLGTLNFWTSGDLMESLGGMT